MITLGDYEYGSKLLGSGAFALVYEGRVKDRPNEPVAIKIMKKDANMPKNRTLLSKEISVLKDLNHENIVRLFHHGVSNNGLYLVMEYCNGGDLSEYLRIKDTLPEDTIRHFLAQIGSAMYAINRKGFMHRDLKPGNILLTYPQDCGYSLKDIPGHMLTFKLADFGFARWLQDGMMAVTMCGSPMYMAPEVLMCREYDARADIWSMGVILYQCLTGKAPFFANNPEQLKNIYSRTPNLRPQIPATTSDPLRRLLLHMLIREPRDRIDFAHFLEHPFLHPGRRDSTVSAKPGLKGQGLQTGPNRIRREQLPFSSGSPVTGNTTAIPPGQGTRTDAFYIDPRKAPLTQERIQQGVPPNIRKAPDSLPPSNMEFLRLTQTPAYHDPTAMHPVGSLDELDDEMSRTTVDDYIEDELDTSALPLEPIPYSLPTPESFRPSGLQPPAAPPVPSRGSSVLRIPNVTRNVPAAQLNQDRNLPYVLKPVGEAEPDEPHLDDFIIVNPNGSVDPFPRNLRPPSETGTCPMSTVGRIVANPAAYRASHPRVPVTQSPLPDVAATSPANQRRPNMLREHRTHTPSWLQTEPESKRPSPTSAEKLNRPRFPMATGHLDTTAGEPTVSAQSPLYTVTAPTEVRPRTTSHLPTDAVLTNSGEYQMATEPIRLRPHSGGGILDYGPDGSGGHVPGGWAAPELSEEHVDAKHNEEIKTITMVLELCELLSELAQRRASVLADCAVTTPAATASASSTSLTQEDSECKDIPPGTRESAASDESAAADAAAPGTTGLKFLAEDQRIVEQIVLYRRVLYYLEYVFVQVKKAFNHGQLRSTPVSRARLNDCYRLYQVCYMRLRELARQSRRDDLIEPVGRLLSKITANRLIFQYALLQCQAAEMDAYVGEIAQAFQRYKAAITLIHGLRQHAKTENDKTLLADCMRILQNRYNSLRMAATKTHQNIGYFGRSSAFPTDIQASSPKSDRSPTCRIPTSPPNPLDPGLNDSHVG
ncbi:Serine/threonine-protein kinase unc-51 [Clonorchis sinensis]|uniref:Serine/threonine-protein kinase unc-51 n=1 Tax=Clonorchis sinensis TaxID=79923 RepID=A0A8T1MQF5_CLOSI|nr:Serine/threonine-protein kinase unc-51 [Clonorchis sinensis]